MTIELRDEWDELCERVKKLRNQGYTVLQIEDETGIDYEDVLWAVARYVKHYGFGYTFMILEEMTVIEEK